MRRKVQGIILILLSMFLLVSCDVAYDLLDILSDDSTEDVVKGDVTSLKDLQGTENFQANALAHILEGELNKKGNAVGFHHDRLPTKKGEVITGSETEENEYGVYEAKVIVSGVEKVSNSGKSTFFPIYWDTQKVVDAINEAYDSRVYLNGNTFEGVTKDGMIIHMYLNQNEKIISAFPIY